MKTVPLAVQWILALVVAVPLVWLHQGTFHQVMLSGETQDLAAVAEVRDVILQRWVEEPDTEALLNGALRGMTTTLDPFSDFISAEQREAFQEMTTGKFGGLGFYFNVRDGYVVVIAPIEDTPAWEAGILPGDTVLAIDGEVYEFRTADEARVQLKGEVGTSVVLTVLHEGAERAEDLTLTRAEIQLQTVKGGRILDEGIGYLRLTSFDLGTVPALGEALVGLVEAGMRGLVLDLRGNSGGYLDSAVRAADVFVAKDEVLLETRTRGDELAERFLAQQAPVLEVPVVVLVDGGSASAAEILAGALKDNQVAALVGTRSYGKGSVQSLIDVLGGTAQLKLTTQYYYTPSGRRIHRGERGDDDLTWGLIPDLVVPLSARQRRDLAIRENDWEMARLARLSGTEVDEEAAREFLHVEDPQVRAGYRHLLSVLGGEASLGEIAQELAMGEEAPEDEAPDDEVPEEGVPEEGVPEDGAPEDGSSGTTDGE